ncbi:hypothetical protein HDU67_009581 [Dinochytrium kinnereticum]|nr:hypothetical protein HDU67_009581 [Dinochytrium kinnereticum]
MPSLTSLTVELLEEVAAYLHPYAVRRLRLLCRLVHDRASFDSFAFAKLNLVRTNELSTMLFKDASDTRELKWEKLGLNYLTAALYLNGLDSDVCGIYCSKLVSTDSMSVPCHIHRRMLREAYRQLEGLVDVKLWKRNKNGCADLMLLTRLNLAEEVQRIIHLEANVTDALRRACCLGHADVVSVLITHPSAEDILRDGTALSAAIESGSEETCLRLMSSHLVDPTIDSNLAIRKACFRGYKRLFKILLSNPKVDPSTDYNEAFRHACGRGNFEMVSELLADPRVNPADDNNDAIRKATTGKVVRALLSDPRVDPAANDNEPIKRACERGDVAAIRELLMDPRVDPTSDNNYALRKASEAGRVEVVKVLLSDPRIVDSGGLNLAITYAGNVSVVKHVLENKESSKVAAHAIRKSLGRENLSQDLILELLRPKLVDLSFDNNSLIITACQNGYLDLVKYLLEDSSVNPTADENKALLKAAERGFSDIVSVLLADKRVDPNLGHRAGLKMACTFGYAKVVRAFLLSDGIKLSDDEAYDLLIVAVRGGHLDVLREILADSRFDNAVSKSEALCTACCMSSTTILRLLLAHPKVDPAFNNYEALLRACANNQVAMVEMLLKDARVDPSSQSNEPLMVACKMNATGVLNLLLTDKRVDPAARDNNAIRMTAATGLASIGKILLEDPRVDPAAMDNEAIVTAGEKLKGDMVELLLSDPRVDPTARNNAAYKLALQNAFDSSTKMVIETLRADPRISKALEDAEKASFSIFPPFTFKLSADLDFGGPSESYVRSPPKLSRPGGRSTVGKVSPRNPARPMASASQTSSSFLDVVGGEESSAFTFQTKSE